MNEVRAYCGDVPVFLLGLKTDLRSGTGLCTHGLFDERISATEVGDTPNKSPRYLLTKH